MMYVLIIMWMGTAYIYPDRFDDRLDCEVMAQAYIPQEFATPTHQAYCAADLP